MMISFEGYSIGSPRKSNIYGVDCIVIYRKLKNINTVRIFSPSFG
ncbi:MAG: hypothetical protein QW287_07160 [Ignisphaera sp.]